MQLSEHFSLEELTHSDTAVKNRWDNHPNGETLSHLKLLAASLEQVRTLLGNEPITINVAYRSQQVNGAVGGVYNSDHMLGYAADFKHYSLSTYEVCQKLATSNIAFDQVINEFERWTHFSINPRMRRQLLRAVLIHGKTMYQQGY